MLCYDDDGDVFVSVCIAMAIKLYN